MWDEANAGHLDDKALISEMDGELSVRDSHAVREHIARCWLCRTRQEELKRGMTGFVGDYRTMAVPANIRERERLRALLEDASFAKPPVSHLRRIMPFALAAASLGILLTVVTLRAPKPETREPAIVPDLKLSPGAAAPVSREYVCRMVSVDTNGVSAGTANDVFQRYGIRQPPPRSYEIDYVVPPALGGSQSVDNLWPQPYDGGTWNSHIKDALEDRLEDLACAGTLSVEDAQAALRGNWIESYCRYFHTEQPLLMHAEFVKDQPWEFAMNLGRPPLR